MATALKPLELPKSIDDHAIEYNALTDALDKAKAAVAEKKKEILPLIRKSGTPVAEKSLRIEGDAWMLTASFGTSSSIDNDVVGKLQAQLAKDKTPRFFRLLFTTHTSYLVSPMAASILDRCSLAVRKLFASVVTTKPKEPSLKVERRKK